MSIMALSEIFKSHAPKVANIIARLNGQRVGSGTGFVVKGHLVTCAHVMSFPPASNIEVRFEHPALGQSGGWSYPAFGQQPQFRGHSDEHSYDYAIIHPPTGVRLGDGFEFAEELPEVGEPVCSLGYPFDDPHLTLHSGVVSAVFSSGVASMVKLDMSVNPSNSGGPLIRIADGVVVGVVARKATGLTQAFDGLMKSYDQNIAALQGAVGIMELGNVDPVAVLIAGQRQMKQVSLEIARSANVGIGYAIAPTALRDEAALA